MEQRIGSSSQPLKGAGFDPAFIPGLTSPASRADAVPEKTADAAAEPEESEEPEPAAPEAEEPAHSGEPAPSDDDGVEAEAEAGDDDDEAEPGGPVFEVSDFRAKIVADHHGVRLRLDDQECEFGWDEIGAVETESPRFGKRFTITVHTPDRRWYPIEIVAKSRSQHKEWDEQLDKVLDEYFEEEPAD